MTVSIILASTSLYRQHQLSRLGLTFESRAPASVDETPLPNELPQDLATRLAAAKAQAVNQTLSEDALVIGADQVASCQQKRLGKPGTESAAFEQLKLCAGKTVTFYTALCVIRQKTAQQHCHVDVTQIHMRPLNDAQIRRYLAHDRPFDCAGAFKAESMGIALFNAVESEDPSAIIGLPLIALTSILNKQGLEIP